MLGSILHFFFVCFYQVQQQVEFLVEIGVSGHPCEGELLLLRAQCDPADASNYLDHAFEINKMAASKHPFGAEYLISLNPDLLMRIADKYPIGVITFLLS